VCLSVKINQSTLKSSQVSVPLFVNTLNLVDFQFFYFLVERTVAIVWLFISFLSVTKKVAFWVDCRISPALEHHVTLTRVVLPNRKLHLRFCERQKRNLFLFYNRISHYEGLAHVF